VSPVVDSAQATLQFDLGEFQTDISLTNAVFLNSKMQEWSQDKSIFTLALDSLDEGRLAISNIAKSSLHNGNQSTAAKQAQKWSFTEYDPRGHAVHSSTTIPELEPRR
jgi:hypothetical protein